MADKQQSRKRFDVVGAADEIGGWLSRMGYVFELEGDNRGGASASRYLCVRKPIAAKIRVSNHRSNWVKENAKRSRMLMLDVGPHAMTPEEAMLAFSDNLSRAPAEGDDNG
jgi:hypothetical protein